MEQQQRERRDRSGNVGTVWAKLIWRTGSHVFAHFGRNSAQRGAGVRVVATRMKRVSEHLPNEDEEGFGSFWLK